MVKVLPKTITKKQMNLNWLVSGPRLVRLEHASLYSSDTDYEKSKVQQKMFLAVPIMNTLPNKLNLPASCSCAC